MLRVLKRYEHGYVWAKQPGSIEPRARLQSDMDIISSDPASGTPEAIGVNHPCTFFAPDWEGQVDMS